MTLMHHQQLQKQCRLHHLLRSLPMKRSNLSPSSKVALFSTVTNMPSDASSSPSIPIPNLSGRKDPLSFAAALAFSSTTKSHFLGSQIHAQTLKLGFSADTFSQNNLLNMYSRCGSLGHALQLFDEMLERNLVSWTSMISGSVHNNEHELGLELYLDMVRFGFHPNEFTLASVVRACSALENRRLGFAVHSVALKIGMESNRFVGCSLLLMYANCGDIGAAECALECICHPDLACWNAMVEGYALNGCGYDAMRTVSFMHQIGLVPDRYTCISAIKGCLASRNVDFGRQIHSLVIRDELESCTAVMNSLADMYFRMGMKECADDVFSRTQCKDHVSWNTAICGFAQEEDDKSVVALFLEMLWTGLKPNQVTLSAVFRLCGAKQDLSLGLQFCCFAYHLGFVNNALVVNSLIHMFSKNSEMGIAHFLFDNLPNRSIITWNEIIAGYNMNGAVAEALRLFCSLIASGVKADEFTYSNVLGACIGIQDQKTGEQIHTNIIKSGFAFCCVACSSLVSAYARFGLVESSLMIFQGTWALDLVSWGAMISAYSKKGFSYEAFSLLNSLREVGGEPDEFILGSALNACANTAVLQQCKCIHSHVIKTGYREHNCVNSAVIDAYAKCGDINSSRKAFANFSGNYDAILFNTMIMAYAHHGMIVEAIEVFENLGAADLHPTHSTFTAIISACGHLGLVEKGICFFDSISSTYEMNPSRDNFACLVYLLAQNGLLEKAKDVIKGMPYEPWPAIWRALLNGSRTHGNKETGELAAKQILATIPTDDGAFVYLSNACAEDGRWNDAENVRMKMKEKYVQKVPGISAIEQ